jgi:hypothetical protein
MAQNPVLPKDVTVHGTLAAALTLNSSLADGKGREFPEWEATWPSPSDIAFGMPFFWEKKWQELLPPNARGLS